MSSSDPLKILVVDDDRSTRMLLKAFLGRGGHIVAEAGNGEEAIQVFEREAPDMILMDVTMPVMTGYEAATIIKQECSKRFVPIIFLTGLNDDESLARCVESGGDDFLVKPFNSVLLGSKITAMQRILHLYSQLELYQQRTEQEIALTHHVFDAVTKRASSKKIPGLDHWMCAAGHFSGDLMIYDMTPTGKLNLMLGDFTGHGFSAAIGALPASDVFFAMSRRDLAAREILVEINRKLREVLPTGHFCATGFVSCDPVQRRVEIFNGGLPSLLILDAGGKVQTRVKSANLALGVLDAEEFSPDLEIFEIAPKSVLVLHSDGVTDIQNQAGEMFGDARLEAALFASQGKAPIEAVRRAVERFAGTDDPDDDISLITLTF